LCATPRQDGQHQRVEGLGMHDDHSAVAVAEAGQGWGWRSDQVADHAREGAA
jgi:hypothetical protein